MLRVVRGLLLLGEGIGVIAFFLLLCLHLLLSICLDLLQFFLSLLLQLFLPLLTLALPVVFQGNCILYLWHMTAQQFLLALAFDTLLSFMLPLEVLILLQQGNKEASTVLVVWKDPHGVVKVHFLG